jgi:Domain of unknown function (DUF4178)
MVRQGSGVENLGKVAEIQPDGSPLRLGVQGQYKGKNFQVIGRIQLQYGDGYWNEWHLIYSNGETGWLGEAMGEYFVSFAKETAKLPSQHQIAIGDLLDLDGEPFVVTGSTQNQLSAYEGELPFIVDGQATFSAFDLRSASGRAATIDYSEQPPILFLGEFQSFQSFQFNGLRQEGEPPPSDFGIRAPAATTPVDKFNCPSCGAPHSVEGGVRSKVLVCEYCGSAVDISDSNLNVIWREESIRQELQGGTDIELGSVAKIGGLEYKLIGYVKKSVTYDGIRYPWVEYLLYNGLNGYRWLVESEGHYTLMEPMDKLPLRANGTPVGRPNPEVLTYGGKEFRHFQTSTAVVDAVAGEFYWRVRIGETAVNFDFVAPPETISMEASQHGFVWSLGVYQSENDIREMFGLQKPLRAPVGVAPAQPNPHIDSAKSVWRLFGACAIAGLVLMLTGLLSGSGSKVFETKGERYHTYRANPQKESEVFTLKGHGNVAFDFNARPKERWVYIKAELVDQKTKNVVPAGATLERFHGKGNWTETVRVSGVPSGQYKLRWELKSGTTSPTDDTVDAKKKSEEVGYKITIRRGVAVWGWYFLMVIVLLPIPLLTAAKRSSFETRRWYNSDHG